MPRFLSEPSVPHQQQNKTAVLLLNLGTPEHPTAEAVRPYLKEFLSDQRVVELPKIVWQPILRGLVLTLRPKKSAQAYSKIWLNEGSPLAVNTRRQTELLAQQLPKNIQVVYAMTYGNPSVANVIADLKSQGVGRLLVIPLYPQYAASSTGAALDKVFQLLMQQRNQMSIRTVSRFYDHPAYIEAMKNHIEVYWAQKGRSDKIMFSFHGVPQANEDQGDPYPSECRHTGKLLAEALGLNESQYIVAFQSQFGKNKWIVPSTQKLLLSLPKDGVTKLDIFCPGFLGDCLETLEEIAIEGREDFHEAGGTQYHYIPCLNTHPDLIKTLSTLAEENLHGWLD